MQPMTYLLRLRIQSSPEFKRQQGILQINFFAFFALTRTWGEKRKKKYHLLVKELLSTCGGFIVPSPLFVYIPIELYICNSRMDTPEEDSG